MITLAIIIAVIIVGAYFMLRAPPPTSAAPAPPAADAEKLREIVLAKLRDRLVGWSFEVVEGKTLDISATDSATERKIYMNIKELLLEWGPLHAKGLDKDADELVDAFVRGATGEESSEESESDTEWIRQALAVKLVATADLPKDAITRPAGTLTAVLILRNPDGAAVVSPADLEGWKLSADEGFATAIKNLTHDVDEGLPLDILEGTDAAPIRVRLATGDPVAASYALIPGLAARLEKRLKAPAKLILVGSGELQATTAATAPEGARLIPDLIVAGSISIGV